MISPEVRQDLAQVQQLCLHHTAFRAFEKGWSLEEQNRFWEALRLFPEGPWPVIVAHIGTKTTRQAMTHAQKLRQKLKRWQKRLSRSAFPVQMKREIPMAMDLEFEPLEFRANHEVEWDENMLELIALLGVEVPTAANEQRERDESKVVEEFLSEIAFDDEWSLL